MTHNHAIVWMDSKEAHIFRFNAADVESEHFKAHNPFRKVHHKAGVIGAGHMSLDTGFFDHIVEALEGTTEWLLVGPSGAKQELLKYLESHVPLVRKSLVGTETMDHPTDGELLDHARRAFKAIDRMLPRAST
jgi:stalled ribosome rescue protein Dom34